MYGIALILVLGVSAQWLAWRVRVPSILLLLAFGFLAGPVWHQLDPDALLGDLLLPLVSLSVALILFEGGMSLKVSELRQAGRVVRNLVTLGAAVTGIITVLAAHLVLRVPWSIAALLGSILLVTGPTVIGPLLRHVRPATPLGPILQWEGIIIDPIGAMLSVLVFETFQFSRLAAAAPTVTIHALQTIGIGAALGVGFAGLLVLLFRRRSVPDHLHSPLTLMLVAAAFVASNKIQPESGLFTVTAMGIAIANQRLVGVQHIAEFKETLSVLLVSMLFIVLAARLKLETVVAIGWRGLVFLGVLVVIARPVSVLLSTLGSDLTWRQRLFLGSMAPRGIVAAAVASVFALRLRESGAAEAEVLVPVTFLVIIGTVLVYGLSAAPLGRLLKLAYPNAQGCLIVGAHPLARAIGKALFDEKVPVLLADTNPRNIHQARLDGLPAVLLSVVSQDAMERMELDRIGRLLALTSNDEVNSLAAVLYARVFGRSEVYQLVPAARHFLGMSDALANDLRGRPLFGSHPYDQLMDRLASGGKLRRTLLTPEFGLKEFEDHYGARAVPMFVLSPDGTLTVVTDEDVLAAQPGQVIISLASAAPGSIDEPARQAPLATAQ